MAINTDQRKGRIKQAIGDLTGDKDLKKEGKADVRAGKAKEVIEKVKDEAEAVVDKIRAKTAKK